MTNPTPHGQVPEALRLALSIDLMDTFTDYQQEELNKAAAELRRLHAENARLSGLCDKWNSECDEFREDNKRLAALVEAQQHARITELEAELEAVGAGGVQALSAAPAEVMKWPKDASEVREFMHTHCITEQYAVGIESPSDDDKYLLSAHDFLSAVNWWADFPHYQAASPTPPAEQQAPTLRRVERTTFPNSPAHRATHAFVSAMYDNHIKGDDMRAAMLWFLGYEECDAALQQAAPKAAPVKACVCGEPQAPGTVHRVDGPCYVAAPQQEAQEPTAFIHWPINGPPRLVWYSQKALNDAILKTHEDGYKPDVKLYTAPQPAPAPLSDDDLVELGKSKKSGLHPWGIGTTRADYLRAVRAVLDASRKQGANHD